MDGFGDFQEMSIYSTTEFAFGCWYKIRKRGKKD